MALKRFFGRAGVDGKRLDERTQRVVHEALGNALPGLKCYPESACAVSGGLVCAGRKGQQRKLIVLGDGAGFRGERMPLGDAFLLVCDANEAHMQSLRTKISYLRPILTGVRTSLGLGDRLGLATPGHIAAGRGNEMVLILAQQSIREMTRTGRSAQQVMDEAAFGVFQCGYDRGFGSDADHLKCEADVEVTAAAGFTLFTIDPSAHVDDTVDGAAADEVVARFETLIADGVPGAAGWRRKYIDRTFSVGSLKIALDEPALLRAAVKYGRAVAHVEALSRHIAKTARSWEIELSVDETSQPTTTAEHFFIACELRERGVKFVSLAPRFVGDFEKGIDFKGDLGVFEKSMAAHAEIAHHYGPYKISVHSGSDKFKVYPMIARLMKGLVHVKTAGTSYLEALRAVCRHDLQLFREIVAYGRQRFETDKATYHISATLDAVPAPESLSDEALERVYLDEDGGRQIMHVTFGSVLNPTEGEASRGNLDFKNRVMALLNREEDTYVEVLKKHIGRHVRGLAM